MNPTALQRDTKAANGHLRLAILLYNATHLIRGSYVGPIRKAAKMAI
jgi:hypothetical protein